ncbi:MAG: hypothetical protein DMG06_04610 [Acidobacteria bacterium]|nr:MAG: hypothetical protein DMG06_04610 [Acidobacteriota bacterium]
MSGEDCGQVFVGKAYSCGANRRRPGFYCSIMGLQSAVRDARDRVKQEIKTGGGVLHAWAFFK